jgi:YfiH family protein
VRTADCAPVVLCSEGVVGVAHVGWRGLVDGVVAATMDAMEHLGAHDITAVLGPCIRAGCYEFGAEDLAVVADRFGDRVRATTLWGTPALDLAAGVRGALRERGVTTIEDAGACTACSDTYFSWRARRDTARFATTVWLADA